MPNNGTCCADMSEYEKGRAIESGALNNIISEAQNEVSGQEYEDYRVFKGFSALIKSFLDTRRNEDTEHTEAENVIPKYFSAFFTDDLGHYASTGSDNIRSAMAEDYYNDYSGAVDDSLVEYISDTADNLLDIASNGGKALRELGIDKDGNCEFRILNEIMLSYVDSDDSAFTAGELKAVGMDAAREQYADGLRMIARGTHSRFLDKLLRAYDK